MHLFSTAFLSSVGTDNCSLFKAKYTAAKYFVGARNIHDRYLESEGFVLDDNDIGYSELTKLPRIKINLFNQISSADEFTATAQFLAAIDPASLNTFEGKAACLKRDSKTLASHSKYRSIDGFGNNLKHPYRGAAGTSFGRFAPKNYNDGVYTIRRSVTGSELPTPRQILRNVLLKAQIGSPPAAPLNFQVDLLVLYITHDVAFQAPVDSNNGSDIIRCCESGNRKVLPPSLMSSACLPITINKDDSFYNAGNIGCLNMVRSQKTTAPDQVQAGEIRNKATSFLDHSIIYGTDEATANGIRSFSGGQFRMDPYNMLPVKNDGTYAECSARLLGVPVGAVYPSLFARNHNKLAKGLAQVNPSWTDETLFQEARRINIAIFQSIIYNGKILETLAKGVVNETYNETWDSSISLEFSAAYRFLHFYVPGEMLFVDANNQSRSLPLSDTVGKIELVQNNFDDALRGTLTQSVNYGQFSDQLYNKFGKNFNGFGLDLISIDIQRGRDHGLPTYLAVRRKCGLNANFTTFDDLLAIFPQTNVDLLKNTYASVEDIDLIIGGTLEAFTNLKAILGDTFSCIVSRQYRNIMGADAYFYSHSTNPYPFTAAQLSAIKAFFQPHLICQNTNLTSIRGIYNAAPFPQNPIVPCTNYPFIDLSAWKE